MVAENVGSPLGFVAVWIAGGVLALAGGLSNAVFVATNAWILINVVLYGVREAIVGLAIVACGMPVYLWFRRHRASRA
jgi:hypothetical protein